MVEVSRLFDLSKGDLDRSWMLDAPCNGKIELFFPERGQPTEPAKKICRSCEYQEECYEYAMTPVAEKFGIWAATSERERRKIRGRVWRGEADEY